VGVAYANELAYLQMHRWLRMTLPQIFTILK